MTSELNFMTEAERNQALGDARSKREMRGVRDTWGDSYASDLGAARSAVTAAGLTEATLTEVEGIAGADAVMKTMRELATHLSGQSVQEAAADLIAEKWKDEAFLETYLHGQPGARKGPVAIMNLLHRIKAGG